LLLLVLLKQIFHEEGKFFSFVHCAEMNILFLVRVENYAFFYTSHLDQVLGEPSNFESLLSQLQNNFLFGLIKHQNIVLDSEVYYDVKVFSLRFLQFALEAFVLKNLNQFERISDSVILKFHVDKGLKIFSEVIIWKAIRNELNVLFIQH